MTMRIQTKDLEAIRTAALPVEYGSITIKIATDNYLDIIVEKRLRLSKKTEKTNGRRTLLAWRTDK